MIGLINVDFFQKKEIFQFQIVSSSNYCSWLNTNRIFRFWSRSTAPAALHSGANPRPLPSCNRDVQANMSHKVLWDRTTWETGEEEWWWRGSSLGENVCWRARHWGHRGAAGRSVLQIWTGNWFILVLTWKEKYVIMTEFCQPFDFDNIYGDPLSPEVRQILKKETF